MNRADKLEYAQLLEEKLRRNKENVLSRRYETAYPWQRKFIAATKDHDACMLMASNQCIAGYTPIQVRIGKEVKSVPFLKTLSLPDVNIRYWVDGSIHDTNTFSAYFQGILPTFRLFLSNGQHLDCSGGHKVLDSEGNYRTIHALMSDVDVQHCYQISEDYQASYDEGDCLDDQSLLQRLDIDQALPPLLSDAQQHTHLKTLQKDVAAHTDQRSQAFLSLDLRSNQDALNRAEALSDTFLVFYASPSVQLMTHIRQVSERLIDGEASQSQPSGVRHLYKTVDYDEVYSNRIFFPKSISLANKTSIIAWQAIGLQPCFDYSIPDHHNYISSGVVSHNCGKSRTGASIAAYHLRGDYPDDWEGQKFDFPPLIWMLGYSGEKTRDLLQTKLFGRFHEKKFEGGLIPASKIISYTSMTGTTGAMREVRVKHVLGVSTVQFWSYTQGQAALMGDVIDWYMIDEEPKDPMIYPQVLTRTINGNKGNGGSGILTFTPENGKTQLVCQFMGEEVEIEDDDEEIKIDVSGMYLQGATWNECPHMTEEKKKKLLAKYPKYQRKMRSEGQPLMGTGLIYEVDEEDISCKPFNVPDYWFVINGMDFGHDHPQAHIQLVWDRDADIFYVINAWKKKRKQPFEAWHMVKRWAENVPTAWPGDGLQHKQQEGKEAKELRKLYEVEGFKMLPDHATWEEGGNGVWVGISQILGMMDEGRFKIVSSLVEVFEEIRQYHTKTTPDGSTKIVKIKDDLLDAIRYAYMMRRHAIRVMDLYPKAAQRKTKKKRTGY